MRALELRKHYGLGLKSTALREKAQFGLWMMLFGPRDFSHLSVPERHTLIKVDKNDDERTNLPEMCKENKIQQEEKKCACTSGQDCVEDRWFKRVVRKAIQLWKN